MINVSQNTFIFPDELRIKMEMPSLLEIHIISISIARDTREVYDFASNPAYLPRWASGLGTSINNVDGKWIADTPNSSSSELTFTLFRQPGMTDQKFKEDAEWVLRDLTKLKDALEQGRTR